MRYLILLSLLLPSSAFAGCKAGAPEPFAQFIAAFARDKPFAVARTRYPMTILRHETGYEDGKEVHATVTTRVAKTDDAVLPTMEQFARDKGMLLRTSLLRRVSATVRMEKPGTDWLHTYHFARRGGCWYLRRIEDHSL